MTHIGLYFEFCPIEKEECSAFGFTPDDLHATEAITCSLQTLADSDKPLIFKPDWSQAQITRGPNATGTMKPAPERGYPQTPEGLPVGTDDTLPGTDIIGGVSRGANRNRIDLYRYPKQDQADRATRRVPVVVYIPNGSRARCPK